MYAGASDDYNPIHYDKELATKSGHDKVIVHGALKSAFLAQLITDWAGPTGRIIELSVTYRSIDFGGDNLICKGRVSKKIWEGQEQVVECEIWLENEDGIITTQGRAVVMLPSRNNQRRKM